MSAQRLKLGRYFGIELYVHWSFGLLVAYVAYSTYVQGGSSLMIGYAVVQLLAVFLCVTLHEYGHSLAARRFGVDTVDITLLPIGGVARLRRIPRIPFQEFVIAVAGPAVNVVIATLIAVGLGVVFGFQVVQLLTRDMMGLNAEGELMIAPEWADWLLNSMVSNFAIFLIAINTWLVLFNMIPAFPMDGGRVLRSLLAAKLPYLQATRWAQRVGVICAALMAGLAVTGDPIRWPLLLIAMFIVYAGRMESRQVELSERVGSLSVGDVMSVEVPTVSMNWTLDELAAWWATQSSSTAAVVGFNNVVVGKLSADDVSEHIAARSPDMHPASTTAGHLADHACPRLHPSMPLQAVLGLMQEHRQLPVVNDQYQLIGWVDVERISF